MSTVDQRAAEELRQELSADQTMTPADVDAAVASFLADCDQAEWEKRQDGREELAKLRRE
jgi:hypothetical protein